MKEPAFTEKELTNLGLRFKWCSVVRTLRRFPAQKDPSRSWVESIERSTKKKMGPIAKQWVQSGKKCVCPAFALRNWVQIFRANTDATGFIVFWRDPDTAVVRFLAVSQNGNLEMRRAIPWDPFDGDGYVLVVDLSDAI